MNAMLRLAALGICLSGAGAATVCAAPVTSGHWTFGPADLAVADLVSPDTKYDAARGFGFETTAGITAGTISTGSGATDYCTSDHPFAFSVEMSEGTYDVDVTLAGVSGSSVTLKSETRRLMAEAITPPENGTQIVHFLVNIRTPAIAGGDRVHLKPREIGYLHWDDKLTLEFSGEHPCLSEVSIKPDSTAITVYLAGDSTVTDQPGEPYNSWGQMLPRWLKPGVVVANYAESGETLKSFIGENRLAKIASVIKSGDYLFIQFGHNDMKDKSPDAGAYKSYTTLLKKMIATARQHGANPVLITPVSRRTFKDDKIVNSFGDYPDAVRTLAKSENVPLIDLNERSARFYEALGPDNSKKAFPPKEATHHDDYGSYEVAKCIVQGIQDDHLDLAKFIVDDWKPFDPSHPDPIDQFKMPIDAAPAPATKPEGS